MKNYHAFRIMALENLMSDPEYFHDTFSHVSKQFTAKEYEKFIKAMKIENLLVESDHKYCAGTHFPKLKITKEGISEFAKLNRNSINHKNNSSKKISLFSFVNIILEKIPKFLKNTQTAIVAITTFVVGLGATFNLDNFEALLLKINQQKPETSSEKNTPPSDKIVTPTKNIQSFEKNNLSKEEEEECEEEEKVTKIKKINEKTKKSSLSTSKIKNFYEKLDLSFVIKNPKVNLKLVNNYPKAKIEYYVKVKSNIKIKVDCDSGETSTLKQGSCTYRKKGKYLVKLHVFTRDGSSSRILKTIPVTIE